MKPIVCTPHRHFHKSMHLMGPLCWDKFLAVHTSFLALSDPLSSTVARAIFRGGVADLSQFNSIQLTLTSTLAQACWWAVDSLLAFTTTGSRKSGGFDMGRMLPLSAAFVDEQAREPILDRKHELHRYSRTEVNGY